MQLDHDVAGECKLVPAVWPWSMPLQTGDRVQLCGLIIYSYNTATLETSGTHCIYLHSCVVALRLGSGQSPCVCVHVCMRVTSKTMQASVPTNWSIKVTKEECSLSWSVISVLHITSNKTQPQPPYHLICNYKVLYWDCPKYLCVSPIPSLTFVETLLVFEAFQRFCTQFSRSKEFWEHFTMQYFWELYFTGIFDSGTCDFESQASGSNACKPLVSGEEEEAWYVPVKPSACLHQHSVLCTVLLL